MCIYKRTLFAACNHSEWSPGPSRPCKTQQLFEAGETRTPCTQAKGHPLATLKVEGKCRSCRGSHEDLNAKLRRAKAIISEGKQKLIGTDERCRAILEDVGIEVSDEDGEEDEEGIQGLREEMEVLAGEGEGKGKEKGTGKGKGEKDGRSDLAMEFLKKRKEENKAGLFMA